MSNWICLPQGCKTKVSILAEKERQKKKTPESIHGVKSFRIIWQSATILKNSTCFCLNNTHATSNIVSSHCSWLQLLKQSCTVVLVESKKQKPEQDFVFVFLSVPLGHLYLSSVRSRSWEKASWASWYTHAEDTMDYFTFKNMLSSRLGRLLRKHNKVRLTFTLPLPWPGCRHN